MASIVYHRVLEPYMSNLSRINLQNDAILVDVTSEIKLLIQENNYRSTSITYISFISTLVKNALDMIGILELSSKDIQLLMKYKLFGLIISDCLIDVDDDASAERRISITLGIQKLFEQDRFHIDNISSVILYASKVIGHFARIASTTLEIEHFQSNLLPSVFQMILNGRSEIQRYSAATTIHQISINSPQLMFSRRKTIMPLLWDAVYDRNNKIRQSIPLVIESILQLISQRESITEYVKSAIKAVQNGFSQNTSFVYFRYIGSLNVLDILCNSSIVSPGDIQLLLRSPSYVTQFYDFIMKTLQIKDSDDYDIKHKVIDLLPKLAVTFPNIFLQASKPSKSGSNSHSDDTILKFAIKHLFQMCKIASFRNAAYLSLGKLFLSMQGNLRNNSALIDELVLVIKSGIQDPFCAAALSCLCSVLLISPTILESVSSNQIKSIFRNYGFKQDLIENMKVIMKHVPSQRSIIQEELLILISSVLQKYRVTAEEKSGYTNSAPNSTVSQKRRTSIRKLVSKSIFQNYNSNVKVSLTTKAEINADDEVILAILTLSSNDIFPRVIREKPSTATTLTNTTNTTNESIFGKSFRTQGSIITSKFEILVTKEEIITPDIDLSLDILRVLRESIMKFYNDCNPDIRKTAIISSIVILDNIIMSTKLTSNSFLTIMEILDRILMTGVGDDVADIRFEVFSSFPTSLDHLLAQSSCLTCIIDGISDELIEVRTAAMTLLCRLTYHDILTLMPVVQINLKHLIKQLHILQDDKLRMQDVLLLQSMVKGLKSLVVPYVMQILEPLINLINDSSPDIVGVVLVTIAELAFFSPSSVLGYLDGLLFRLIQALNDMTSSNIQRDIAVAAIGKLVPAILSVTEEPYKRYPGLLDGLYRAILNEDETDEAITLRQEAIRTAGLLGIVDASTYQSHLKRLRAVLLYDQIDNIEKEGDTTYSDDEEEISNKSNENPNSMNSYYHSVVIRRLIHIIRDNSLIQHHEIACAVLVKATNIIVNIDLGNIKPYLSNIFDALLFRFQQTNPKSNLRDVIIDQLVSIVEILKPSLLCKYMDLLIKLIKEQLSDHLQRCLELLDALFQSFSPSYYSLVLAQVLPDLISFMNKEIEEIISMDYAYKQKHPIEDSISVSSTISSTNLLSSQNSNRSSMMMRASSINNVFTNWEVNKPFNSKKFPNSNTTSVIAGTNFVNDSLNFKIEVCEKILYLFLRISPSLDDYKHQIIPVLIYILSNASVSTDSKKRCCALLLQLSMLMSMNINSELNLIIHHLVNLIDLEISLDIFNYVMTLLAHLLCTIQHEFVIFILPIKRKISHVLAYHADALVLKNSSYYEEYERLVAILIKFQKLPEKPSFKLKDTLSIEIQTDKYRSQSHFFPLKSSIDLGVHNMSIQALESAWAFGRNSANDLLDWMRRLSIELIRQSPAPIIRCCLILAKVYRPLSEHLFNISFYSIWEELFAGETIEVVENISLINSIEAALKSSNLPKSMISVLLNLIRFMDMQGRKLPIDIKLLESQSKKANMFADCLRYNELEYSYTNLYPSYECIESLITVNNELGLIDRSMGVLSSVMLDLPNVIEVQPVWYEKLNLWDEAIVSYLRRISRFKRICRNLKKQNSASSFMIHEKIQSLRNFDDDNDYDNDILENDNEFEHTALSNSDWMENELGLLRCFNGLGEYEEILPKTKDMKLQLEKLTSQIKERVIDLPAEKVHQYDKWMSEIQRLGANAAWSLGQWSDMEDITDFSHYRLNHNSQSDTTVRLDKNLDFYKAIIAIHKEDYSGALMIIKDMRNKLSGVISALLFESYPRAYRAMVTMQILSELEEIVEYKENIEISNSNPTVSTNLTSDGNPLELRRVSSTLSDVLLNSNYIDSKPIDTIYPKHTSVETLRSMNAMFAPDILKLQKVNLVKKWKNRLKWAPKEISVFRQILSVHSLVVDGFEDLDSILELVSMCRKEGMFTLCENILRTLGAPFPPKMRIDDNNSDKSSVLTSDNLNSALATNISIDDLNMLSDDITNINVNMRNSTSNTSIAGISLPEISISPDSFQFHRVMFSTMKYWWVSGQQQKALKELNLMLDSSPILIRNNLSTSSTIFPMSSDSFNIYSKGDVKQFRVQCLLKKAEWMRALDANASTIDDVMDTLVEAKELNPDQYEVWHAWAVLNYDQLQVEKIKPSESQNVDDIMRPRGLKQSQGFVGSTLSAIKSKLFSYDVNSAPAPESTPSSTWRRKQAVSLRKSILSPGANTQLSLANMVALQQEDRVSAFVTEAIKGFVRSIILGQGKPTSNILQDTLRLLTLWFSYGAKESVTHILETELNKLSPDHWISVLPQLIARIHIKSTAISTILRNLLIKVAKAHPQALVCPISVALNSNDDDQRELALDVINEIRKTHNQLVEEAAMMSSELMRVAITPSELWFDGIEKACAAYLDGNILNMMTILNSLHAASLQKEEEDGNIGFPSSLRDIAFHNAYGSSLSSAKSWLHQYQLNPNPNIAALHQAWDIYYSMFKRLDKQIKTFKKFALHHISPELSQSTNLQLAVPGTYHWKAMVSSKSDNSSSSKEIISIARFSSQVSVIQSKQRPRRITLIGSNGKNYSFLLKGNEDLRQDERVMQLFGLINACLMNDNRTKNRAIDILRYSVLPLSNNSGLIGWVQHCDTFNQLITNYRMSKGLRTGIEMKLLQNKSLNYDMGFSKNPMKNSLTTIQKLEIFEEILSETTGQDLASMLWLKSNTADIWVERRMNYTRSLAVMSIAGYILGLGDRHPSNLMLHRVSGRVIHIDFGDCFEITATREKFPEIVPFRLTRMLTKCMEKSGIEGTYRVTCERVMRVLRDNKDSVMAMLEAFVYDPLISWKVLTGTNKPNVSDKLTTEDIKINDANININAFSSSKSESRSMDEIESPHPIELLREQLSRAASIDDQYDSQMNHTGSYPNDQLVSKLNGFVSDDNLTSLAIDTSVSVTGGSSNISSDINMSKKKTFGSFSETKVLKDERLPDNLNIRALEVITRIQSKLTGKDFNTDDAEALSVEQQVERLILEATSNENLCQLYVGWCSLW